MKTNLNVRNVLSLSTSFGKVLISALFLFALQSICFGQIYSYTDVSESGGTVIGYGSMSGSYEHSGHTTSTQVQLTSPSGATASSSGGESATAYINVDQDGWYFGDTIHITYCPVGNVEWQSGSSSSQTQTCQDTCSPCRILRTSQGGNCLTVLVTCEGTATAAYLAAINSCENNAFCQSGNPNFNQEECDRCKDTALAVYGVASAACGTAYAVCMNNRVDCTDPYYKTAQCTACTNP